MKELLHIFGTKIKSMEILFLLNNIKPVVRQGFYNNELKKVEEFCKENKLFLVKSKFKINIKEKGFSNKGILAIVDDTTSMIFVYISKDELSANKASYFEITQDHFNLGLILGYPKCCALFFQRQFPIRSKLDNDYEIPILENSKGDKFPFQNNIFLRQEDYCLISHFPCNLNCDESKKIGNNVLEFLNSNEPQFSEKLVKNLKKKLNKHNQDIVFY